jgi:hypothetical protein
MPHLYCWYQKHKTFWPQLHKGHRTFKRRSCVKTVYRTVIILVSAIRVIIGGKIYQEFFFFNLLHQQSEYKVLYKLMCWLGLVCRLTSMMRSPPARRSCRPCYRSAGHHLFNLCMTSSCGRGWSSGFGCEASFVRCLILLAWMTSCTVGIPRSLWIISLVTYHGVGLTQA